MSQFGNQNSYYGGGGGYMPNSGGGRSPFSASSPGGHFGGENSRALRPLTIAQISKATQAHADAEWRLDDVEVGSVTVVGCVVSVQSQSTNHNYTIDDGTGRLEARHWVADNAKDTGKWKNVQENTYVRIIGTIKRFGNKRYIKADHIRPVKDAHEIYFHTLEAITICLINERGLPSTPNNPVPQSFSQQAPAANSNNGGAALSAYSTQGTAAVRDRLSHLSTLQKSIVRFIMEQPATDEGIHISQIVKTIGGKSEDARKISEALEKLMDDGDVFTTIDESHFNVSM